MRRAGRAVPHQSLMQVYWEPLTIIKTIMRVVSISICDRTL